MRQADSARSGRSREFHRRRTTIIHRTVRCAPDCPVSQRSAGPTVGHTICAGHVAEPTARRGHRTVRCAPDMSGAPTAPKSATVGCAILGRKSGNGQCPVRHATEGKNCLPRLLSTAPSCLGAIKGTPRRMEEYTKHTLSILNHSHSVFAHSIDILSDLSSVLVVNFVLFI